MITIFEQETVIGRCPFQPEDGYRSYGAPEYSIIYAHSIASVNGSRGLLKIEQHCYLRHDSDIPDQPWIKPDVILEPPLKTREAMIEFSRKQHEKFCERVRVEIPNQDLLVS